DVPRELMNQLKIGGCMVIPIGEGDEQKMLKITKKNNEEYSILEFGTFKFVPMLERTVK
ncbi:MAG: protein-L-isoaspartate O-methyltransferase, partial [Crocinitomicaceae bacterium]